MVKSRRPILVTGSHRSGSTWVGKMISASPLVGYIPEPFNWQTHSPGIFNGPIPCWFPYITKENQSAYYEPIRNMLEFRYNLWASLKMVRSLQDARRVQWEYRTFRYYRRTHARPLIKDPFALFSAEWLAETFDMDVIILIRHPAAFVSSIKRLNWSFPFSHFLQQPLLMRDHLSPYEAQIKEYVETQRDLIDQASLLWKIIYSTVARYRERHGEWIFVRHEDLSRDPIHLYRDIFMKLGLDFSPEIQAIVQEHSAPSNPSEVPVRDAFSLKRNSRAGVWTWKKRLTASEIRRVRASTEEVARAFYSDEDW